MTNGLRHAATVGAGILCWSNVGWSQPAEPARLSRVRGESFVLARYATGGATSLYAAARVGRGTLLAGAAGNRQTRTVTPIVGLGTRLRFGTGISSGVFVAVARSSRDYQARLYALPRVATGRVAFSAITLLSQSASTRTRQLSVNPVTAAFRMKPWLQLGGAAVAEHIGQPSSQMTGGPAAHVRIMGVVLSLESLSMGSKRDEFRVSVTVR